MRIITVKFKGTTTNYAFKTNLELNEGDTVVCDTALGFSVGIVTNNNSSSKLATKWIVQKVDFDEFNKNVEKEKKLEEVKSKMESRKNKLQEMAIYKMLSENDEEMKKLLEEYNSII